MIQKILTLTDKNRGYINILRVDKKDRANLLYFIAII